MKTEAEEGDGTIKKKRKKQDVSHGGEEKVAGEAREKKEKRAQTAGVYLSTHQHSRVDLPLHHYVIMGHTLLNGNTCTPTCYACVAWCVGGSVEFSFTDAPGQTDLHFKSIGSGLL